MAYRTSAGAVSGIHWQRGLVFVEFNGGGDRTLADDERSAVGLFAVRPPRLPVEYLGSPRRVELWGRAADRAEVGLLGGRSREVYETRVSTWGIYVHQGWRSNSPPPFPAAAAKRNGTDFLLMILPFWVVVTSAAFPVVPLLLFRFARRSVRRSRGYCMRCGYDLRMSPARCPECGAACKAAKGNNVKVIT